MGLNSEDFVSRLEKRRRYGEGWIACCPSHDDKKPSLSVKEADNGHLLIHCWGGCGAADVVAAMGLSLADLFNDSENVVQQRSGFSLRGARMHYTPAEARTAMNNLAQVTTRLRLELANNPTPRRRDILLARYEEILYSTVNTMEQRCRR